VTLKSSSTREMNDESPHHSAKAFDPVAFAEWWYENVWPEHDPQEFGSYVASAKRWDKDLDE
jgi:hypothetical protein